MTVWGANNELYHHGTKGMKWGNRRYQNEDGSLTEAGKKRYGYGEKRGTFRNELKRQKAFNDMYKDIDRGAKRAEKFKNKEDKYGDKYVKAFKKNDEKKFYKNLNKWVDAKYQKEQALKDVDTASKRMSQGAVKALNMTAKEIDYRKAYRDYMKFSRRNTLLFGAPISVIMDSTTKKGKELTKNLVSTSKQYKQERDQ